MDQKQVADRIQQHVVGLGGVIMPPNGSDYVGRPEGYERSGDVSYTKHSLHGCENSEDAYAELLHYIKSHINRLARACDKDKQTLHFGWRVDPAVSNDPLHVAAHPLREYGKLYARAWYFVGNMTKKI